jgi:hypothetical protein
VPRDRTVTMGKISPEEAHDAAIARSIELYSPYAVVDKRKVSRQKKRGYLVVYRAPLGGEKKIVGDDITTKETAKYLRDVLSEAWAEGYWSSQRE